MISTLLFISGPEIFIVVLVVVLLFGSKKIPELARGLGRGIKEFKNATSEIQREITKSTEEIKKTTKDLTNNN